MPRCVDRRSPCSRAPTVKFRLTGTLPATSTREVRERAADRRRQQQSDHLLTRGTRAKPLAQEQRADERAAERQRRAGRVGHAEAAPVTLRRADERGVRACRPSCGGRRIASRAELHDRLAHLAAAVDVDGSGAPNATVTGYGKRRGHFQKNRPRSKLKMLPQTRSR